MSHTKNQIRMATNTTLTMNENGAALITGHSLCQNSIELVSGSCMGMDYTPKLSQGDNHGRIAHDRAVNRVSGAFLSPDGEVWRPTSKSNSAARIRTQRGLAHEVPLP